MVQAKALELEQLLQTMAIAGELPIGEECPACKSEIPFRDVRTAACQNGHPWSKRILAGSLNDFIYSFANAFQSGARSPHWYSRLLRCERALGVRVRCFPLFSRVWGVIRPRSQKAG